MAKDHQYWLVGAAYGGVEDRSDAFVAGGYWEFGYSKDKKPEYHKLREQMQKGDRIAIKAVGGKGSDEIIIKALGIIEAVDPSTKRVWVDWAVSGLNRRVPSRGLLSTIHPPFSMDGDDSEWLREVFSL